MWGAERKFPPLGGTKDFRGLLRAARTRCEAAINEVAAGPGDVSHDLCAIACLEHDRLCVFPRFAHRFFLLSCFILDQLDSNRLLISSNQVH